MPASKPIVVDKETFAVPPANDNLAVRFLTNVATDARASARPMGRLLARFHSVQEHPAPAARPCDHLKVNPQTTILVGETPEKRNHSDFLDQIWKNEVQFIVNIGQHVEGGRSYPSYTPIHKGDCKHQGQFKITCTAMKSSPSQIVSEMSVEKGGEKKTWTYVQLTEWKDDKSAPSNASEVHGLVSRILDVAGTCLLHSVGRGRASTVAFATITVDLVRRAMSSDLTLPLQRFRACCLGGVPEGVQFLYCHLVVVYDTWYRGVLDKENEEVLSNFNYVGEQYQLALGARNVRSAGGVADDEDGEDHCQAEEKEPIDLDRLLLQPCNKIVFNAPYDDKHTYYIKITNAGGRRIGWAIKTTNMKRLVADPPCGVLDPKEAVLMAVSCDAFKYGEEDTNNDRITFEWTHTPDGAAKIFRREWFQIDGTTARKNLPIDYN